MAVQEILSTLVDKGTDYLIDVPLSYLQKGLNTIGLGKVGNVLVNSGNLIGGGIDKLALGLTGQGAGNFGGGLGDLYTGVDTLVGGVLPRGQDFGAGYLGQMFGQGATDGATKATSDGLLSSQDVYGNTFTDARLMDGTPIKFTPSGKLATSLVPNATGLNGFIDKVKSGAKLASAVGTVARMLDGGGGSSGGTNPTTGRAPASQRIGGSLGAQRRMSYPQASFTTFDRGIPSQSVGGLALRPGIEMGDKDDKVAALIAQGVNPVVAEEVIDEMDSSSEAITGGGETEDIDSIDMFDAELNKDIELRREFDALVSEENIPVDLGSGRYSFNPVTF